jgi:hypothetical protein
MRTLSFRVSREFGEETRFLATATGRKMSDYVREAVQEKNAATMTVTAAALSRELSAAHLTFSEEVDNTLKDGLD